ncbi:MAG TPA: hypothetical protein VN795_02190 [Stellaceae bacterium]|jgi:hypothetical protein|nr:hypothetical protein [Stellaceae bacterium]
MKRIAPLALLLLAPLLIVACNGPGRWSKEGVTPAMAAADLADCNSFAQSASRTDANINQDILAARGKDWQDTGALATMHDTYQARSQDKSDTIVFRCMVGKGYAPG